MQQYLDSFDSSWSPSMAVQKLRDTMNGTEEWRAMKVIVIGHGQIGKTSLVSQLHDLFNQNQVHIHFYHIMIHFLK